jgi:putative FmdB family regulatory protein
MPIYEYLCPKCNLRQEYIWFSDVPARVRCDMCATPMDRLLSVPARPQLDDNATWLQEHAMVVSQEHRTGERPIKTRTDFNNVLAEKGIRQKDSFNRTEV